MKTLTKKELRLSFGIIILLIMLGTNIYATSIQSNFKSVKKPVLALLPFKNNSGYIGASDSIRTVFEHFITELEIEFITGEKLQNVHRKHRIRSLGSIDMVSANQLSNELGINHFLIGSIDVYSTENQPQIALSLRLVEANSLKICWAKSVSTIGSDYSTVLGLGEIKNIRNLSELLIAKIANDLKLILTDNALQTNRTKNVAIIQFDDLVPNSTAGALISSQLLSKLIQNNISIIEPGEVNRICRNLGKIPRGEISLNLMRALADSLSVDFIITGSLDYISSTILQPEQTSMKISFGARLLEVSTGKILVAKELERRHTRGGLLNSSSGSIFNVLLDPVLEELIDKLDIKKRTQLVKR